MRPADKQQDQRLPANGGMRGIILLAHGSRDPLWKKPIEAVASQIGQIAPTTAVRCAYLEATTPDLASSAAELADLGIVEISVVPLFMGVGKHAREDLPVLMAALRAKHPQIAFNLRPSLGEEPQIIELIARIAIS
jgi:sirohydrochlorin cobaltochelatase